MTARRKSLTTTDVDEVAWVLTSPHEGAAYPTNLTASSL